MEPSLIIKNKGLNDFLFQAGKLFRFNFLDNFIIELAGNYVSFTNCPTSNLTPVILFNHAKSFYLTDMKGKSFSFDNGKYHYDISCSDYGSEFYYFFNRKKIN